MKKRLLAMLLALVMCLGLLPVSAVAAEGGGVQERLDQIMIDYPNGSYFTKNGKACTTHDVYHGCDNCSLLQIYSANGKTAPYGQGTLWTCKAFAAYVMNQVFGVKLSAGSTSHLVGQAKLNGNEKESYKDAKVGDLIYFYNGTTTGAKNTHIAVCMGTTNDTVTFYECNSTGNVAQISYRTKSYSRACEGRSGKYISIYRANNYEEIDALGSQTSITDGTYTLTPACAPNACLDVAGGSKENKANVQIYAANGTDAQSWKVQAIGEGYYCIASKASGKVLDSYYNDVSSCQNVVQNLWYIGGYQQWKFKDAGDGYYYLIPLSNENLCLDVSGGGYANGTNVQLYTANQSNAQKWKLTPVNVETGQTTTGQTTTRTEYRYGRYAYTDYRLHTCWCQTYMTKLFGSATLQYSDWSTTRYSPTGKPWTCGICNGNHIGVDHYSNGRAWWNEYSLPDGDYFWEESRTVTVVN